MRTLRNIMVAGLTLIAAVATGQNEQLQAANDIMKVARGFLCLVDPSMCQGNTGRGTSPAPTAAVHVVTGSISFVNGQLVPGATVRITFQPSQIAHVLFSTGRQYNLRYFAMQPTPGVLVATFYDVVYGNAVSQIEMQFLQPNGGRFRYSSTGEVLEGNFLLRVMALH